MEHGPVAAHPPPVVGDRTVQQLLDLIWLQGLQLEDPGAGQQGAVHLKIGILCSGADQDQGAVLYIGQQIVLLAFIKAVDLVYEQDRLAAVHAQGVLGRLDRLLHIFLSRHGGVQLAELGLGGVGDHPGQGGLSGARRAVEDQGAQLVRLDGPVQQLVLSDDMPLPHHLV